jgi:putative redox protein
MANAQPVERRPTIVTVEEAGPGQFAEIVRAGRHVLSADEPFSAGGTDSGPNPYEYLLGALGTCTTMTLRMYIKRKNWPVGRIVVRLEHDHIYAQDCADCEQKDAKLNQIKRVIRFEGDLDDERRQRLLEIANKCPVHQTLTSKIEIATSLD